LNSASQVARIQQKLGQARDAGLAPDGHTGLRLGSVLSEQAVRGFEDTHGILLPDEYRQFVTQIGGSGAGPYYGILPLDDWDSATWSGKEQLPDDFLARPSPLMPENRCPPSTFSSPDLAPGLDPLDQFTQGAIVIAHMGCAYYALLIVSGPARGRIVYIEYGDPLEFVYFPDNPNFLSWYERWVDELLAGYNLGWFGFGATGTEDELARALTDASVSAARKTEAIRTLRRIRTLTPLSLESLSFCLREGDPNLRAAASSLFIERSGSAGSLRARELLSDESPLVRIAVLQGIAARSSGKGAAASQAATTLPWYVFHDPEMEAICRRLVHRLARLFHASFGPRLAAGVSLAEVTRILIHDADPEVAATALRYAKGVLAGEEIRPCLSHSNPKVRRSAAYAMSGAPDQDVEVLLSVIMNDRDLLTRIAAVQALRPERASTIAVPLAKLLEHDPEPLLRTNIINVLAGLGCSLDDGSKIK
jgi:HEAT repeat protein